MNKETKGGSFWVADTDSNSNGEPPDSLFVKPKEKRKMGLLGGFYKPASLGYYGGLLPSMVLFHLESYIFLALGKRAL